MRQPAKNNIYLLSQPIQTGKTTLLLNWVKRQRNVAGILTPDVNGIRKLYDISGKDHYRLQLDEGEEGISIGRFVFDRKGFETAQHLLNESMKKSSGWIVVDEVGRLEMDRNEGLEPALGNLVNRFKQHAQTGAKLLLVIRDYLLNQAIAHYKLEGAIVLPRSFFEAHAPLSGLVLCGGKSVRMGYDKALISYHNKPQYEYMAGLMEHLGIPAFISCNLQQKQVLNEDYQLVIDNATFGNAGPLTGVLTAFESIKETALLVTGCDYPYFKYSDMLTLTEAREPGVDVVCYKNQDTGFEEPLLAIYEQQCAPLLLQYYKEGHTSLRHFLKTVRTKYISTDTQNITSIDF